MKRLTTVALVALLIFVFVPQAFAGPPEQYTVEFLLVPTSPGTAGAEHAYVCPVAADPCDDQSALDVGTVASSWVFRPGVLGFWTTVHGQHTFMSTTCADDRPTAGLCPV